MPAVSTVSTSVALYVICTVTAICSDVLDHGIAVQIVLLFADQMAPLCSGSVFML
jgi:hypothetical protein